MKNKLRRIHWLLSEQFGIDLRRLTRSLRGLPHFMRDLIRYRRLDRGPLQLQPCLHDRYEEGGVARGEYFLQDLHVARKIHAQQPAIHVDIGSRIDGFVAHVASFREIEVLDIRPIRADIPGVKFRQADLTSDAQLWQNYCDSLSCLHALEHFGLGRYGDPLDADGSRKGLRNMASIVRPGGLLYLSVPIGRERVVFNANRVFNPRTLLHWAQHSGLVLKEFAQVHPDHGLQEGLPLESVEQWQPFPVDLLGIFTFQRIDA